MTMCRRLKALNAMNSLGLWKISATPTREFRAMDFINKLT